MSRVVFLAMFLVAAGCSQRQKTEIGNNSGSDLAEANVGFPDKSKFGDNALKLTGFMLDVKPDQASCKGAFSTTEAYVTSKKFPQTVQQGCDYTFVAEVGAFDATSKKMTAVYFSNRVGANKGKRLTAAEFKGKTKFAVTIQLDVTEDGKKAGFTGSTSTMTETDLQIEVQFGDASNRPSPTPSSAPQNLWPSAKEFSFTDESGVQKNFSEFAAGAPYLLIDVSGTFCSGCIDLAGYMNRDSGLQSTFSGKCKHMTIEYTGDINGWKNAVGNGSFASHNTVKANISQFQRAFPEFRGTTPTLILVAGDGRVLAKEEGSIPAIDSQVKSACGGGAPNY